MKLVHQTVTGTALLSKESNKYYLQSEREMASMLLASISWSYDPSPGVQMSLELLGNSVDMILDLLDDKLFELDNSRIGI